VGAGALLTLTLVPAPGGAAVSHYRSGNCQWNNPHARVLCVGRADWQVCRDALGRHQAPCWWFTGSDTQVIFNWSGKAATS